MENKASPTPPWTELRRDITVNILHRLGAVEILETAQKVCKTWYSVCKDPAMWRVIDMHIDDHNHDNDGRDVVQLCLVAVHRSQGQLVDINLERIVVHHGLLDYIAASCGKLRRLRLAFCYGLGSHCHDLLTALKSFPELEELHIVYYFVSRKVIDPIGRLCPLLRSFTLNIVSFNDKHAMAIARSMPGLRRLQFLSGLRFTNIGVEAILNGCPRLESLDFRCPHFEALDFHGCNNLQLTGDVRERCLNQIKYVRFPEEHVSDDYEVSYDSDGIWSTFIWEDDMSDSDGSWDNKSYSDGGSDRDIDDDMSDYKPDFVGGWDRYL